MDFRSKNLSRQEVAAMLQVNNERIMELKNSKKPVSDGSDEAFEVKQRVRLEENLLNFPKTADGLKAIIVEFPESYKGFVKERNYFEDAFSMISSECANLGFVCAYGCTLDFGTNVYDIHPNGSTTSIRVISHCVVYVLPSSEAVGKDFVQEISNAWQHIIHERYGITPEVQVHENLQTRLYRELQHKLSLCDNSEQLLFVLNEVKEVAEQLAKESIIFPEKLQLLDEEQAELKRR